MNTALFLIIIISIGLIICIFLGLTMANWWGEKKIENYERRHLELLEKERIAMKSLQDDPDFILKVRTLLDKDIDLTDWDISSVEKVPTSWTKH